MPALTVITGSLGSGSTGSLFVPPPTPTDRSAGMHGTFHNPEYRYPNDAIQLDVYNAVNQYFESDFRTDAFSQASTKVTIDVEKALSDLGYISGQYNTTFRFIRNLLGSGDAHKLVIQEISADRLEARVRPVLSTTLDNTSFVNFFAAGLFSYPKANLLTGLQMFKTGVESYRVFDYVQDKFTFKDTPYSIILKFAAPLASTVLIGDQVWVGQEIDKPLNDVIRLTPPPRTLNTTRIAGPNWEINTRGRTNVGTRYKDWDDLLSTNTSTSNDVINSLLSGSLLEGIPLNVDFRVYDNFIHFGSAEERLRNFKYKLELLEYYDSRLSLLSGSSASSSIYVSGNIADLTTKRSALLGAFDSYEKYLYYESASYVTNSFGEFWPTTWPKSNSTAPYINYSTTASQAEDWFEGALASASLFDKNNEHALRKFVPEHVLEDPSNDQYVLFVDMVGHYFDLMYAYVKQMSLIYDRNESLYEGFSKDLVFHIAQSLNINFENGNVLEDLWSYVLGTDSDGVASTTYGITSEERTKEIWKRVVNNLPYLLKTKGTDRGLRALINCFGIPRTILRIREYGGPEPLDEGATDWEHDRFFYATRVGYGFTSSASDTGSGAYYSSSYYDSGSLYGTSSIYLPPDGPVQRIVLPWSTLAENNLKPMAIEIRAKIAKNQTHDQTIFEVPDQFKVRAFKSGSGDHIGFFLSDGGGTWLTASVSSSIYDNTFHQIALQRANKTDTASDTQVYSLIVKKPKYGKVVATYTASLTVTGSAYNGSWISSSRLWIPGSESLGFGSSSFTQVLSGSVQEFRYWTEPLQDAILDNHTLAPTSFQGNTPDERFPGSTSSFDDLAFRLCLGSDNRKVRLEYTSSLASQHPNQTRMTFADGLYKSGSALSFFTSSVVEQYEWLVEEHGTEWPSIGGNRSVSNKIRIDETTLTLDELYRNVKVEKSLRDNYPIDSPRLGVYFSPQSEINEDIAEQFGGINVDDLIGDPRHIVFDHYPDLYYIQYEYAKKYLRRNLMHNYIRLVRHYDASMFQLIKQFIPYRANAHVGLLIEPTVIERAKLPMYNPTLEDLQLTCSLQLPSVGDLDADTDAITGGDITQKYVELGGDAMGSGEAVYGSTSLLVGSFENDEGNQYAYTPSSETNLGESSYGVDTNVEGSTYEFYSYARSGSGWVPITSSRYDYSEALNPVIMAPRFSDRVGLAGRGFTRDLYGNKAFINYYTASYVYEFDSSASPWNDNDWVREFGLQILPSTNAAGNWSFERNLAGSRQGLIFEANSLGGNTGSVNLLAFSYTGSDALYEVEITVAKGNPPGAASFQLFFGGTGSAYYPAVENAFGTVPQTFRYETRVSGTQLHIKCLNTGTGAEPSGVTAIWSVKVRRINSQARVQEFHLNDSYGMRTARYDGSKITSAGINVDSPDTVDKGPVVQVIETSGVVPTTRSKTGKTFKTS